MKQIEDIEFWKKILRQYERQNKYEFLCVASDEFCSVWKSNRAKARLRALARKFVKENFDSYSTIKIDTNSTVLFTRGVRNTMQTRIDFINWMIKRLDGTTV